MKTGDQLVEQYVEALEGTIGKEVTPVYAIALAMPFFIELLADIRDVLWEIESKLIKEV